MSVLLVQENYDHFSRIEKSIPLIVGSFFELYVLSVHRRCSPFWEIPQFCKQTLFKHLAWNGCPDRLRLEKTAPIIAEHFQMKQSIDYLLQNSPLLLRDVLRRELRDYPSLFDLTDMKRYVELFPLLPSFPDVCFLDGENQVYLKVTPFGSVYVFLRRQIVLIECDISGDIFVLHYHPQRGAVIGFSSSDDFEPERGIFHNSPLKRGHTRYENHLTLKMSPDNANRSEMIFESPKNRQNISLVHDSQSGICVWTTSFYGKHSSMKMVELFNTVTTQHVTYWEKFGVPVIVTHNQTTKTSVIISQAMMTNSETGLRFRGTFSREENNGKVAYQQIKKDDDILYDEKDDTVLVDKINPKEERKEWTIGWKLVKNDQSGEHRILKVAIPPDAKIVTPIDSEILVHRMKKRCDKFVVSDIQLPTAEETSVVPEERSAISCVYDGPHSVVYRLGEMATPHDFDEEVGKSCTAGLHFFGDRQSIFETYLKDT